ncbi:PD-(D/E)XK nuclease family transposase [uncultured Clostridium sp.]|nr:PD-(D/E)XK nuclease family transposase [uncultured Clostridium sp.]
MDEIKDDQLSMKLKNDYVFKRIFGNPKNSDLIISLLE